MDANNYDALSHASSAIPSVSPHVSGIPQQSIWEEHKSMFIQLYVKEKKTLREVKAIAEKDFAFPRAPLSTYESKFRNELGLKKKLKWFDWIAIHDHISHLGSPKVEVLLDGNIIPPKKLKKEINRNLKKRAGRSITIGASNLPEGVEIRPVLQKITAYDCQIVTISPAIPQPSMVDASLIMQPFSIDIQPPNRFPSPHRIVSNQLVICSTSDPLLVNDFFGSSEMSMEVAESLFFSTAKEVPHITSRLPGRLQMTYDLLSSRLIHDRSASSILVLDPEFRKLWSSMLDHLPIRRALIDPATSHHHSQDGDHYWSSDEDLFTDIQNAPPSHYLSSAEHRHQRLTWPVQEIGHLTASPMDAPLSTSRDVFHVINGVLYLLSNNPNKDEALEYVRELVAQSMPWSIVEAILKIPSQTIQSIWVLLADCAFELYERRLFDAVANPASDHTEWLARHGCKWLTQAAVLGSAALCRKLMELGISSNVAVDRNLAFFHKDQQKTRQHDVRPWTTTGLQTSPSWYRKDPFFKFGVRLEIELYTSPLVEAVVKGHVETFDVLVEGGANFEERINGCTAVGHLLHSLFHNNVNLEARLQILQKLLELGARLDVPFYDAPRESPYWNGSYDNIADISQDTIADMVWQTNCPEAIHVVQNYAKACPRRLTVHGILRAASSSAEELADLIQSSQAPTSAERLSIERTALMKAIDKPEVLLNMIKAELDLHEPRELIYINFGYGGLEYAHMESFVPRNIILEKYLALIAEQPLHPFARHILQSISPQAWLITPLTSPATGPIHWNILILAAIANPFADRSSGLDLGQDPASIETLNWLIAHGTDIPSCIKTLNSIQDTRRSIDFDTKRLEWLLAHNIRPEGKSLCGIFMDYVSLDRQSVVPPELTTSLFEPSKMNDLPLFEPCSAMIDQSGQSVIKEFVLVYFIKVGAPVEFLQRLCDSGIDCNTPARFCDFDKQPLSWHFFTCDHDCYCKCLTPLQAAISANRIDVVQYLLEKGANANDGAYYNALQFACTLDRSFDGDFGSALSARIEIVECLLINGADPGGTKVYSLPALRVAIRDFWQRDFPEIDHRVLLEQHVRLLEVLMDASVGTDAFDTVLTDALRDVLNLVQDGESQKAVTKVLLAYKTDIDKRTWRQVPYGGLLMKACRKSDIDKIKTLLDQGVSPNWAEPPNWYNISMFGSEEPSPYTPSAVLAAQGNIPLLLLLRAAGAQLVKLDNSLECAASAGRLDTVAWLLQFENREEAFARAMMRAHLKKHIIIRTLIEEHLRSIGSDLLEHGNWQHPLYYSNESHYANRFQDEDFEDHLGPQIHLGNYA
ncbi:hypothetical protein G7054_g9359 [Neopestalotiopsis clavispora]|nr:hypothetical protein G7054_g9359 [Neopestalotiopsis clavispora]